MSPANISLPGAYREGRTWAPVNLDRIQHWIDQGRLESTPGSPITARELLLSGCIHDAKDGIKLLGDASDLVPTLFVPTDVSNLQGAAQLKVPVHITASRASKSAIRAVEKLGGSVFCKYYNDLALRDCLKGRTNRTEAAPVKRTDIGV